MIKNKQVNVWRGNLTPPTLYHLWLKDENLLLRYDEEKQDWVVFLDSNQIKKIIEDFLNDVDGVIGATINGHPLKNDIVLSAADLLTAYNGKYIKEGDTIANALRKLDLLFTTEVYEQ